MKAGRLQANLRYIRGFFWRLHRLRGGWEGYGKKTQGTDGQEGRFLEALVWLDLQAGSRGAGSRSGP